MSGATPLRSIRIDDATWARIKARAARLGMSASQYIIRQAEADRDQLAHRCATLSRQIAQMRKILELEE